LIEKNLIEKNLRSSYNNLVCQSPYLKNKALMVGEGGILTINFPNQSRAYDATRRAVRFWGYDSALEASFFVNEDALRRIQPDMRIDEMGLLSAFDLNRDLIYATAAKVYMRGRRGSYDLIPADFRKV
jgi:hypothetical protein